MLHTPTPDEDICTVVDVFDPQPTPMEVLPDPATIVPRFAQAIVDVLSGQRSLSQLNAWVTPEVLEQLGPIAERAMAQRSKVVAAGPSNRHPGRLPRVVSTRITTPARGVVEASAVVSGSPRSRAVAMRFEGLDGRWRCTALGTV
jgi:hypothetical protein